MGLKREEKSLRHLLAQPQPTERFEQQSLLSKHLTDLQNPVPSQDHGRRLNDHMPLAHNFYEGTDICDLCTNWVNSYPMEMPEHTRQQYDQAGIFIYMCKDHDTDKTMHGGFHSLKYHSMVIRSQMIIDLIRPALKNAGFLLPQIGEYKCEAPFKSLYFAYDDILNIKNQNGQEYIDLLVETMNSVFAGLKESIHQLRSKRSIDYQHLWTLFPRNMKCYRQIHGIDRLVQVIKATELWQKLEVKHQHKTKVKMPLGLQIDYEWISFDGINFGWVKDELFIPVFDGEVLVTDLDIYPLNSAKDYDLEQKLTARGKKVLEYQCSQHCEYQGIAREIASASHLVEEKDTKSQMPVFEVDCEAKNRVMVDTFYFSRKHPKFINLTKLILIPGAGHSRLAVSGDNNIPTPTMSRFQGLGSLGLWQNKRTTGRRPTKEEQDSARNFFMENPGYLMFMNPELPSYFLKHNKWYWIDVNNLSPIVWATGPLDRLILESPVKSLLNVFTKQHAELENSKEEIFIDAKGRGLAVLLTGPPGTGKTLTVEAIAEEAKLPLYHIMAGELGSSPEVIASRLLNLLELALEWNLIVLLDEADMFLQNRFSLSRTDSEIVSIFLRQLEYYRGIIFLTTNLPSTIDNALRSRCRFHISYKLPNPELRYQMWKQNFSLRILGKRSHIDTIDHNNYGSLSESDIEHLKEWKLTGRDISNVVENLYLWSYFDGETITLARVEDTIRMTVPEASKTDKDPCSEFPLCLGETTRNGSNDQVDGECNPPPKKKRRYQDSLECYNAAEKCHIERRAL